jgi:hypothetical protein
MVLASNPRTYVEVEGNPFLEASMNKEYNLFIENWTWFRFHQIGSLLDANGCTRRRKQQADFSANTKQDWW